MYFRSYAMRKSFINKIRWNFRSGMSLWMIMSVKSCHFKAEETGILMFHTTSRWEIYCPFASYKMRNLRNQRNRKSDIREIRTSEISCRGVKTYLIQAKQCNNVNNVPWDGSESYWWTVAKFFNKAATKFAWQRMLMFIFQFYVPLYWFSTVKCS